MNVIVINGSPKGQNSNTYRLTQAFISGLKNVENLIVYDLNQLNISKCLGCFNCWKTTPGICCIQDDMQEVLSSMINADCVIWSFPLYYFGVPGPLKTFIDRQLPLNLPFMDNGGHPARFDLSKQRHILISTCGFYTSENNYDSVTCMFDHFLKQYETIFCGQGELFRVPELSNRTNEYLNYVKKAGEEFYFGAISSDTKNHLNELLFPKETFEAMANASWGLDQNTGEKLDESLIFTQQMANLYNKHSYQGKDIVLEMNYTDIHKNYQILLGEHTAEVICEHFKPYTTRIQTSYSLWQEIAAGKIRGDEALMQQLYKVDGDFDLMIHWDSYFGGINQQEEPASTSSKTNLLNVLVYWMLLWIFGSYDSMLAYGSIIGCSILFSFIRYHDKKTIYDHLSKDFVIVYAVLLMLEVSSKAVLSLSYLSFGLMWILSCKNKTPLTAHYSANTYGGNKILNNPIFIKTNQILTLLWGILYIATAIWTYILMSTSLANYIGIINSILPMILGIFTVWFQKWYPAKIAKGNI